MKAILIAIFTLIPNLAMARTHVVCGRSTDPKTKQVYGFALAVLSEMDDFTGPVGEKWQMKMGSPDNPWVLPNPNITAETYISDSGKTVEIKNVIAQSPSGPVGILYKIIGIDEEEPVLEKYTMGGVVGLLKTHTFLCVQRY